MNLDEYIFPFPKVLRIEPSGACNLHCSHCPTGTVNMKRGIMHNEIFQLVLQNMKENIDAIKVVVLYHGGEPLLNKNFVEMVKQIKMLGVIWIKTVSNGMLLSEDVIEGIVASGLDQIEFSLDGEHPEENNYIRRGSDYATVVTNIKRLIEYKRNVKTDFPEILIANTQFLTSGTYNKQKPHPPEYLIEAFSGEYADDIASFKCTWAMRWPDMEVSEDYDVYHNPGTEILNECDQVKNVMTIRWDGSIVACCYDLTSQCIIGNIQDDNLATIWNNKKFLKLRQSIDKKRFVPLCANCNVVRPNAYLTLKQTP